MKSLLIASVMFLMSPALAAPLASRIHEAIEQVCPIEGVSIEDKTDKKTWRIQFKSTASSEQKAAAQKVIDAFDLDAPDEEEIARQKLKLVLEKDKASTGEVVDALKDAIKTGVIKLK